MITQIEPMPGINEEEHKPDFHAVVSITLGELINWGWIDWSDPSWKWDAYNDEQYLRVCHKIEDHYWTREISMLPPGNWKRRFINLLNEVMPKYKKLYTLLDEDINILQSSDEYYKGRDIYSNFPQTQLNDSQDYADTGKDSEYERIYEGDPVEKMSAYIDLYRDVDMMIIRDLEVMFASLISVNVNGL